MSNKESAQEEQDFKVAMQQLSAEAEKILPSMPIVEEDGLTPPVNGETSKPGGAVAETVHALEKKLLGRFEEFAAQMVSERADAFDQQFRKIDEQLALIRSTESVNQ